MSKSITHFVSAVIILLIFSAITAASARNEEEEEFLIRVKGGPDSVVWVVQLSDLHFSVHHPDRAFDFRKFVAPALSIINPSIVLITGDLTGYFLLLFLFFRILFVY